MQARFPYLIASLFLTICPALFSQEKIDYETQVAPIFDNNCIDCHDADKTKSALRIDLRPSLLKGGDSGLKAIVPGHPDKSYLLEVVQEEDPDYRMPPKGDPLTKEEIAILTQWIAEGAEWPGQMDATLDDGSEHWSFKKVVRPVSPGSSNNPVDAFLNHALNEKDITPNPPADPRALLRRLSITLTGLPPTAEETQSFLTASQKDPDAAYLAEVDRLLDSLHFGERWAQHWLDVIRWAETNGSEANLYRKNAFIFRDYVIRAFNEDLPYNQFITEQLAGDQLGAGEATGFLVAGPHVPAATVGAEPTAIRQARADRMDEVLGTVGASMLGVTVSCARCHNHKFDPVSIQDYYSLSAVFQGVEFGGRRPEFSQDHPRKKRGQEIRRELAKIRKELQKEIHVWEENWGGFTEMNFPPTQTQTLRIDFLKKNVGVDELQVFGPAEPYKNLAHVSRGTTLVTDDKMTKLRGEVWKANDGEFGTMAWRSEGTGGEKPWLEIRFPKEQEVSRFRFSSNREYYFETDYLEKINTGYFPDYKISALKPDGTWLPLAHSVYNRKKSKEKPEHKKLLNQLHALIDNLKEEGPQHSFVGRFIEPVVTRVLLRGSPETPRDEVPPAGFEILDGDLGLDSSTPDPERRLKFAEWLTNPEHPLTARVMVNRLWHHIFGAGIVATGADFGLAGAPPSHPELLDWLAAEFVEPSEAGAKPWSTKDMIRLIVTTEAFKRSSLPNEVSQSKDAGSTYLWRYPPRRVEAEVIRDGILLASNKLDRNIGGRSFRIHNVKKTYSQWQVVDNYGPSTWRRMIYQERMRRVDDQIFTAFDFPDCGQVRAKRPVSTTPLQALNLMNSPFVIDQSKHIAERAIAEAGDNQEAQAKRVFELILARQPDVDELTASKSIDLKLLCRTLINSNEFAFLP